MHGVMKNIAYLCKRDRSKTWDKDCQKKVVVCIVSGSHQKINSHTKRTNARQSHACFFEKLDQLLRERHVLSYVRSANRCIPAHPLTPLYVLSNSLPARLTPPL